MQALRAENGGYRRKLETTMQRLELAMQQVRATGARVAPSIWSAADRVVQATERRRIISCIAADSRPVHKLCISLCSRMNLRLQNPDQTSHLWVTGP